MPPQRQATPEPVSGARTPTIRKSGRRPTSRAIADYEQACATFSWQAARAELGGLPGGRGLNIAHEAVDRHAAGARAAREALRWIAADGSVRRYSYRDLRALTNRFANALGTLGVGPGERVFTLTGRVPELYAAALGTLKNRSVLSPLFAAFGPEPIRVRIDSGAGRVLVTTENLYRRKVAPIRTALPSLEHVILTDGDGSIPDTLAWRDVVDGADDAFDIPPTDPEDWALLHFTSGTTGKPKGAIHVHEAVVAHHATARFALDLRADDVFWCTADPGWVTGTSYGIVAPLAVGATLVIDAEEFDAARWYRILEEQAVTVWYTAPTAIRMLMRLGVAPPELPALRFVASVGEPLHPEAVIWGKDALGRPIHDNWWQTETGAIMIANVAARDIKPGSMGRPVPGVAAAIVQRGDDGRVTTIDRPGRQGELALRIGWPSMFRGYLDEAERYRKCFTDGWYLSGELARRDEDGDFWFVGRADDVIKSAGHLIGPFEAESALLAHPAVAEAGVIGKPDPVALVVVKAFVALKPGHAPTDELRRELLAHARRRLGAVAPREIAFRPSLPKTRSGKILRRLLKAEELGLSTGDLSTLEQDADPSSTAALGPNSKENPSDDPE